MQSDTDYIIDALEHTLFEVGAGMDLDHRTIAKALRRMAMGLDHLDLATDPHTMADLKGDQ